MGSSCLSWALLDCLVTVLGTQNSPEQTQSWGPSEIPEIVNTPTRELDFRPFMGLSWTLLGLSWALLAFQGVPRLPRASQGVPERFRTSQGVPGRPRACQNDPGSPRMSQGVPGRPRISQGLRRRPRVSQGALVREWGTVRSARTLLCGSGALIGGGLAQKKKPQKQKNQ